MASAEFTVRAVGVVRNDRSDVQHTDNWADVITTVAVDERFGGDCLRGLADFSHVDVVYVFDRLDERPDYRTPRSSRGRADLPAVGVFADRGPRRPNRIGVTTCAVVSVHGRELTVRGLDAVDGTPVLDIKPAMKQFHPTDIRQPEWVDRLMAEYFDR